MPSETIGLVIEKMRKTVSRAIGAAASGLCLPSASNQPIWPRRATITVAPGRVPLSISRLNASDRRCNRKGASPSVSGLAWGSGGVCGAAGCLAAACGVMISPLLLLLAGLAASLTQNAPVEQAVNGFALAVDGFALAIRTPPMLETARIGGDAGSHRSVAQLVEHRSPKPGVAGSSPATPASPSTKLLIQSRFSGGPSRRVEPSSLPDAGNLDGRRCGLTR